MVTVEQNGTSTLVRVEGDLTIFRVSELKGPLLDAVAGRAQRAILLDLAEVDEMDTAGYQLLWLLKREAEAAGGSLRIAAMSSPVRGVLDLYHALVPFGAVPA